MSKSELFHDQDKLETDIVETLIAGLQMYRSDLTYPQSHSDLRACARGLIQMFEIKRSAIPIKLKYKCDDCDGIGHFISEVTPGSRRLDDCKKCNHRGYIYA